MSGKAIVLIEDERDIRETMKELLELEGYQVEAFANGKEAVEALPALPPASLILLDLMMPEMSGWEFLEFRKHHEETWTDTPVVVVSAMNYRVDDPTVAGSLSKPADINQLLSMVQKHCA